MQTQAKVRWSLCFRLPHALLALVLTHLVPCNISAQNALDATTPPGQSPGAPAGAYSLSGFDNVNLFNGHLNFRLPLLKIAGRGEVGFGSVLAIEQRWTVDHDPYTDVYHFPNYNWWTGLRPGYGPGVLQGRQISEGCPEDVFVTQGSTRLTFTVADGTEYELRDQIYNGQVASSNCNPFDPQAPGTSRGTIFKTPDGATTFVSDTTIYDHTYTPSGPNIIIPSGYLMLRDGTRFRIDSGLVTWMRDRNGNKFSFTYEGSWMSWRITSATDSLNRQVTYQYNFSDPTYGVCDRIIFKGFGGAQRIIRIVRTALGNALISGESLTTYHNLFPNLHGSSDTYHNPDVVSIVWLPDGRSYQFRYNRYGELSRINLPTGGRFEYSWAEFPQGMGWEPEINRRVTERRTYTETGALATRSTYGSYESSGGTEGTVQTDHFDFGGALLSRDKHYFHGHPFSYTTAWQFQLPNPIEGQEFRTEQYASNGTTILRRIDNTWVNCGSACLTQTVTTLDPATANLVSKQTFSNGACNNRTDVYQYGFGVGAPGSLVRRTHTDYLTTNPVNGTDYATTLSVHMCSLPTQERIFDGAGVERARTTYEYDNYTPDANHAALIDRANISGLDPSFTTGYGPRGNVTAVTRYLFDTAGTVTGFISTYEQYDIAGNKVKSIDGRGYATQFDFADRFGIPDGNAQANSGATELGSQVSYAFVTKATNALAHIAYSQFDFHLGKPVDTEDPNGIVSSLYYNDSLDRLTQERRAVGTGVSSQTTFAYDDGNRVITTSSDLDNFGDNLIVNKTLYDGLGRTTETRKYEGGGNYIVTQQQYDALNRPFKTSNPFRPWQSQSAVWTTKAFDGLGRVISVTAPDNAVLSTSYSGNSLTITDPAGKATKTVADALGRLIEVYEDPNGLNYQTTYTYDVLDNLVKVTQGGQHRFFMYDSLKRLIRTRNPEQNTNPVLNLSDPVSGNSAWSIGYQYDNNNNLTFKTDSRGIVTENRYDALSRVTTILYRINGQPDPNTGDVEFLYDNAANGKGRLWLTYKWGTKPSHTAVGLYDALGRVTQLHNLFGDGQGGWSAGYSINRTYNRAGKVTSQTYPSGRTVSYSYDSAGRTSGVTGTLGDGLLRTYATGITYSQFGPVSFEQYGTNTAVYNKLHYNIRGQLYDTRVSNMNEEWSGELGALVNYFSTNWSHGGSGPDNNGNVLMSQSIVNAFYAEDRYSYDALNRLTAVNEWQNGATHTGSQQYDYDRWGNRTINPASWGVGINNKQFTVDTATNRLAVPQGQSGTMTYDNAGNLINDTYSGFGNRIYDGENRITAAQDSYAAWSYYTYNANGQRVRRNINNQETWQIYGIDNELLAEYPANGTVGNPQKEYGYRNGQLLVTTTGATCAAGYIGTKSWGATSPSLGHNTGQQEGTDWAAYVSTHSAQHMVYGPYDTTFGKGRHQAQFQLQIDNNSGNDVVATVDVTVGFGSTVLAQRQVRRNEFTAANTWQWFTLDFDHPCFGAVEARIWWHDTANIKFREMKISSAGAGGAIVNWLVMDHLGTPRMIFDQSGSYASVKRHDYLPFGEELFAGSGGRTAGHGYVANDGVRQQFTSKERDVEIGLDYFTARYYASTQGRFTSVDPASGSIKLENPQSLNRYSYALNNPLKYVDPDGRIPVETALDVVSIAHSFYELVKNPSWVGAGFLVWDIAATFIPYVPGSYVAKGIKLSREAVEWSAKIGSQGYMGLKAAGIVKKLDDFETAVNNQFIKDGVGLLGQGDDSVRQVLGMSSGDKAADFLGVTQSGTFKIAEAKGSDLDSAVKQLDSTAKALDGKVGKVEFTAEVVLRQGQKLQGDFEVVGNHLHRRTASGALELQKANGKAITVRYHQ